MVSEHKSNRQFSPIRASAVDLQHLRYALAAADHGSFRRAAEVLLLRQSTLSRCISQLEHSLGMVVFERSSGGVRATAAGRFFLRTARSILEQMDSLVNSTVRAGCGEAGRLSVGRLVTALRNGALDIAIVTSELPLLADQGMPLWSERILLALLEGHPLADREVLYWTDLRGETVLLSQYDPGRELEDLLMSKLVSPEDRPKIARHDVSRGIIKSLIAAGFGVSLVTESDIGANFSGLTYRELRDGTGPSRVGFSAHWRSDNDNPALANFLKLLGERYPLPVDRA